MIEHLSQPTNTQKGNKDLTFCWSQVTGLLNDKFLNQDYLVSQIKEHYKKYVIKQ